MDYFPVFLRLEGRTCLVVGGGDVGARKARSLLDAHASVRLVAPRACAELTAMAAANVLAWERRPYQVGDLDGVTVVIAATDDRELNARVSSDAQAAGIPVNVVDDPALCTFIVPAIVDRSPVLIAISTGGASPALARHLRARVEAAVPAGAGALAGLLSDARQRVRDLVPGPAARAAFWEGVVGGEVGALGLSGRADAARRALEAVLERLRS
jgi:uroporphyrin-III C-methyltransferase/precorrin-2 dehydrogenase/sirohydrochlorin ferrochelatase